MWEVALVSNWVDVIELGTSKNTLTFIVYYINTVHLVNVKLNETANWRGANYTSQIGSKELVTL